MSDTRNHTTRDVLLAALMDEYGGTEQDWTAMRSLHRVATQVRAAAVAETTAAIEAVAQTIANAAAEPVENFTPNAWRQLLYMAAHDVRAALSGGRTALDTTLAQAWDDGCRAAYDFERGEVYPEPANPYRADTGADQ